MDDYDEFGNYIGPLSDSDEGSHPELDLPEPEDDHDQLPPLEEPEPLEGYDDDHGVPMDEEGNFRPELQLIQVDETSSNQIVLHEDKKYYPSASEVYGEEVETLVQEEDAQPLTQPIVEPVKIRRFAIQEEGLPETRFDREFMVNLMSFPDMVRNVAVVGHLHHGKSSLMDMLVFETHKLEYDVDKHVSSTDQILLRRVPFRPC